jgi:Na+-driven multidrug efflux pump
MGYAFITVFVNGFGDNAIAAFGITTRLDSVIVMPAVAIMMAASTLTAQNIGRGTPEKIREVFKWGIVINIPVVLVISLLCLIFPSAIMGIFVKDSAVIQSGIDYLRIVGGGYLTFAIFYVSNGIINGAGRTMTTMVISAISLCLIRIPLAGLLSHTSLGVRGIWFSITISFVVSTVISLLYYYSGRWIRSCAKKQSFFEGC